MRECELPATRRESKAGEQPASVHLVQSLQHHLLCLRVGFGRWRRCCTAAAASHSLAASAASAAPELWCLCAQGERATGAHERSEGDERARGDDETRRDETRELLLPLLVVHRRPKRINEHKSRANERSQRFGKIRCHWPRTKRHCWPH